MSPARTELDLYFAYGSNMSSARLRARVASAREPVVARLDGHQLVIDKHGRDDTAKANLRVEREGTVWGVVFRIEAAEWPKLDRFEGDYERIEVGVLTHTEQALRVLTYVSERRVGDRLPSAAYLRHLLDGASEHGLPEDYLAFLAGLPSLPER